MQSSDIILGTMRWGSWGASHSRKAMQILIETGLTENINSFDLADIYGDYTTEKEFGSALSGMSVARENVFLITKCGINLPGPHTNFSVKHYDYSREHIRKSVHQSLKNLQTEYLDMVLLHRPSPLMNPADIAETFTQLQCEGKVRGFGVSNFPAETYTTLDRHFPLTTNQVEVSLNQTKAFRDGTLDVLLEKNLRPMAYSVLGNYFSVKSAQNSRIAAVLHHLCKKYGAEEEQILLAFLRKHPSEIQCIIGTTRAEKIQKLASGSALQLETEDWFRLLEASAGTPVA